MPETYCGKECAQCIQKEALACPGCKAGPGRQFDRGCELALCTRSKGHESCDTCGFQTGCMLLRSQDRMAEKRLRARKADEEIQLAIAERAPYLGKWLWLLFWLVIPSTAAGLMANETMAELSTGIYIAGQVLSMTASAAYGLILMKLSEKEDRYRTAGICSLIACGVSAVIFLVSGTAQTPAWTLLISVPGAIVSLVGQYHEYMAHAAVLMDVDKELSDKWERLWKWQIGFFCGIIASVLLLLISPILGLLALLAAAVGVLVAGILKLVYLYRTAMRFREYPVSAKTDI